MIRSTRMIRPVLMAVAASALIVTYEPSTALAQRGGPDSLSRQEMVELIQRRFQDRLAAALELDETQRQVLVEVFESYGEAREELLPRKIELAREVRALLDEDTPSDARAQELLAELRAIRQEEASLMDAEEARLLEALTPVQVLRLQFLRDEFGEEIRRLGRPDGPGGRGPGRRDFP